jgi:hypothetical protein
VFRIKWDIMQQKRISGGKWDAFVAGLYQRQRWQIENDLLAEQLRKRRLENRALEIALIERAIAAGIDPAISKTIAESRCPFFLIVPSTAGVFCPVWQMPIYGGLILGMFGLKELSRRLWGG